MDVRPFAARVAGNLELVGQIESLVLADGVDFPHTDTAHPGDQEVTAPLGDAPQGLGFVEAFVKESNFCFLYMMGSQVGQALIGALTRHDSQRPQLAAAVFVAEQHFEARLTAAPAASGEQVGQRIGTSTLGTIEKPNGSEVDS